MKVNRDLSVLGIITARGGSKEVPRKNIIDLCGKPLINYTIEESNKSKLLTRTIVSTDDKEIANIAKEAGAEVPFIRPAKFATDTAKSIDVVIHAIKWIKQNEKKEYDYVMILQPTSPLRTSVDIDKSIKKAMNTNADSVMSMVKLVDMSIPKLKKIYNDQIVNFVEDEGKMPLDRNQKEPLYKRNTAIYLTKTSFVLQGDLFGKISRPYIMPMARSIDINEKVDLDFARFFLNLEKNGNN